MGSRAAAGRRGRQTVCIVAIAACCQSLSVVLFVFIKSVHRLFLVQQFSPVPCFLDAEFPNLLLIRWIFPNGVEWTPHEMPEEEEAQLALVQVALKKQAVQHGPFKFAEEEC